MKRVIIAGGRNFTDQLLCDETLETLFGKEQIEIVSGGAYGADLCGEETAKYFDWNVIHFHAEWAKYGKKAGYIRNKEMANVGTHLVAFWDGESKGTASMIKLAGQYNIETVIIKY